MSYVIEEIEKETKPLEATTGTAPVKFEYYVNGLTPKLEEELKVICGDNPMSTPGLVEMIVRLVASWDIKLKKTDKQPCKVERAIVERIPKELLWAMSASIYEDRNPNEETAPAS